MSDVPATPTDLSKLTVPQLKALCKDRGIAGYSKLNKLGLLQKLADHVSGTVHATSPVTTNIIADPEGLLSRTAIGSVINDDTTPLAAKEPGTAKKTVDSISPNTISASIVAPLQNASLSVNTLPVHSKCALPPFEIVALDSTRHVVSITGVKRHSEQLQVDTPPAFKKQKSRQEIPDTTLPSMAPPSISEFRRVPSIIQAVVKDISISMPPPPPTTEITPKVFPALSKSSSQFSRATLSTVQKLATFLHSPIIPPVPRNPFPSLKTTTERAVQQEVLPKARRFKPLVPKAVHTPPLGTLSSKTSAIASNSVIAPTAASTNLLTHFRYLDYPQLFSESPVLVPITLPPKLAHRKYVHKWSVILSGISDKERRSCVLVSRMFRYAVYLSATRLLEQHYHGRRLTHVLLKYPKNMTNMWPYLRQREREVETRMQVYAASFVAKHFKGLIPVDEHLLTSPDNEKQIVIATRFALTRLWFLLSVGDAGNAWSSGLIVDAQEVVRDEIWTVTVQKSPSIQPEAFYILEPTCEVVGHPPSPAHSTGLHVSDDVPVRADWWAYIAHRQIAASAHDSLPSSLLAHLKWQNHEEYFQGVSKLWLKRIAAEGDLGGAKRKVADRYVLACVVGNRVIPSVSGSWMSSTQMEQDFAGNSPLLVPRKIPQEVNLFLPAHHHVESLHFSTADGTYLHPALAVVQTPGREYFILRDNGMQVGCEEDGVGDIWREFLECTARGTSQ